MTDKRIDDILTAEETLAPSSGFIASVMERVREEAAAPPPIPFPWKRAVPGFVLAAGVLGWGAVEFVRFTGPAIATIKLPQVQVVIVASSRPVQQAGWVLAALAVSLVSWMVSRRVAG
jgi:hypothetical protein